MINSDDLFTLIQEVAYEIGTASTTRPEQPKPILLNHAPGTTLYSFSFDDGVESIEIVGPYVAKDGNTIMFTQAYHAEWKTTLEEAIKDSFEEYESVKDARNAMAWSLEWHRVQFEAYSAAEKFLASNNND